MNKDKNIKRKAIIVDIDGTLALIDKRRPAKNKVEVANLVGELKDKHVLIIDDMIDTAGTLCNAANTAKKEGAKSVTAIATHPVLSGKAITKLELSIRFIRFTPKFNKSYSRAKLLV